MEIQPSGRRPQRLAAEASLPLSVRLANSLVVAVAVAVAVIDAVIVAAFVTRERHRGA